MAPRTDAPLRGICDRLKQSEVGHLTSELIVHSKVDRQFHCDTGPSIKLAGELCDSRGRTQRGASKFSNGFHKHQNSMRTASG
jgi:hypothetical protein